MAYEPDRLLHTVAQGHPGWFWCAECQVYCSESEECSCCVAAQDASSQPGLAGPELMVATLDEAARFSSAVPQAEVTMAAEPEVKFIEDGDSGVAGEAHG